MPSTSTASASAIRMGAAMSTNTAAGGAKDLLSGACGEKFMLAETGALLLKSSVETKLKVCGGAV